MGSLIFTVIRVWLVFLTGLVKYQHRPTYCAARMSCHVEILIQKTSKLIAIHHINYEIFQQEQSQLLMFLAKYITFKL